MQNLIQHSMVSMVPTLKNGSKQDNLSNQQGQGPAAPPTRSAAGEQVCFHKRAVIREIVSLMHSVINKVC
jgi:hypothetical protein